MAQAEEVAAHPGGAVGLQADYAHLPVARFDIGRLVHAGQAKRRSRRQALQPGDLVAQQWFSVSSFPRRTSACSALSGNPVTRLRNVFSDSVSACSGGGGAVSLPYRDGI